MHWKKNCPSVVHRHRPGRRKQFNLKTVGSTAPLFVSSQVSWFAPVVVEVCSGNYLVVLMFASCTWNKRKQTIKRNVTTGNDDWWKYLMTTRKVVVILRYGTTRCWRVVVSYRGATFSPLNFHGNFFIENWFDISKSKCHICSLWIWNHIKKGSGECDPEPVILTSLLIGKVKSLLKTNKSFMTYDWKLTSLTLTMHIYNTVYTLSTLSH